MQRCPLASNPALSRGGIHLASLAACLPATDPPFGTTHCLVLTHIHTPIPHCHHLSPSGQIAAAVRQMSDDRASYLSDCMTMGLWAEIERQKPRVCHTPDAARQLILIVCCTISCQAAPCRDVLYNAPNLVTHNWIQCGSRGDKTFHPPLLEQYSDTRFDHACRAEKTLSALIHARSIQGIVYNREQKERHNNVPNPVIIAVSALYLSPPPQTSQHSKGLISDL